MAREFKETAHLKTDKKKYAENFDAIDWGDLKDKPLPKPAPAKHKTAGLCGEYGLSTFDKEEFDKNFDNIDWGKKPQEMTDQELIEHTEKLLKEINELRID